MRVLAFDEGSHQKRKIYLVSSVCLETPKTPECDGPRLDETITITQISTQTYCAHAAKKKDHD